MAVFTLTNGIRIGKVHLSNQFVDGGLENRAWISEDLNPANRCMKPMSANKVAFDSFWQDGPAFLREREESWPIKFFYKNNRLEGEVVLGKEQVFLVSHFPDHLGCFIDRSSV